MRVRTVMLLIGPAVCAGVATTTLIWPCVPASAQGVDAGRTWAYVSLR